MDGERKPSALTKTCTVVLIALFCCLLWGSATPCIKVGYGLFSIASEDTMSQILFAGIRFTLAGILTILFSSLAGKKMIVPEKGSWSMVFVLALFQTIIQYFFSYIGLAHTTGVNGTIIIGMNAFFAVLISSLIFRMEKLTPAKIIGCLIGLAGIAVITLKGKDSLGSGFKLNGEGFMLVSSLSYALSSVLIKRFSTKANPVALNGYQFVIGGLVMVAVSLLLGGKVEAGKPTDWFLMLYLGFISAAAYTLWSLLLKYNPVSKITAFTCTTPVFGVILSIILLNEGSQVSVLRCVLALALVTAGILIVNRQKQ